MDDFFALNVDVSVLVSHSVQKFAAILCVFGYTFEPNSTYICLRAGWLMDNVKSCNL